MSTNAACSQKHVKMGTALTPLRATYARVTADSKAQEQTHAQVSWKSFVHDDFISM